MDAPASQGRHDFRPDIEGLRGVAVLLVVLFHGNLLGVPGGYVGVDVFFVISGFLITGLLVRERERSGRIGFRAFYARRVRRLLPAGMVALAATLAATSVALAPLDRPQAMVDGAAAALSVGNIRFALAEGDYFASVTAPSPFLHFWSLSVEEQFYLVWPAVLFVAARGRRARLGAAIVLASIAIGSLLVNLWLTDVAVSWAYYSLPSRAWQLALGGLLAIAGDAVWRVPRPLLSMAGWVGLAVLVVSSLALDGSVPYPGAAALAPTLATAALVACGTTRGGPGALLALAPLRFLGRISYSLYLWHWPVLVLAAAWVGTAPPLEARVGLVVLATILATVSWRWIEEPFRAGFPLLAQRQGRTILAGALAVVLVVGGASSLAVASSENGIASLGLAGSSTAPASDPDTASASGDPGADPAVDTTEIVGSDAGELADRTDVGDRGLIVVDVGAGAAGGDPFETSPADEPDTRVDSGAGPEPPGASSSPAASQGAPAAGGTPGPTTAPGQPVSWKLPKDVRPPLSRVRGDEERLRSDGCLAYESAIRPPVCVYGVPKADFTVALVGDSHAAQWFPALNRIATARGWRLLTYVKVACPFVDMPVFNLALKREYRECGEWRTAVIRTLRDQRPDLTIVSSSRFAIRPTRPEDAGVDAQGAALARLLDRLPGRVAVIVDTPEPGQDVPSCLSRHPDDVRKCAIPKKEATSGQLGTIERRATRATGAAMIDLTRRICPSWPCPVVSDGIITFRDHRHISATFARSMAGGLERALVIVLEPAPIASSSPSPSAPVAASGGPAPAATPGPPGSGLAPAPRSEPSSPR